MSQKSEGSSASTSTCSLCEEELDLALNNGYLKYHNSCIKCNTCKKTLAKREYCMIKKGRIYCDLKCLKVGRRIPKDSRCQTCQVRLNGNTKIIKLRNNVYHPKCVKCSECDAQLKPGQSFGIKNDKIVCNDHRPTKVRKPIIRTIIEPKTKVKLLAKYRLNRFPSSSQREQIGKELDLPANVVKTWFQNHRARNCGTKYSIDDSDDDDF